MGKKLVRAAPAAATVQVMRDAVVRHLTEASAALERATSIDQVKLVMDAAAAQQVFAKRQDLGEELIGFAHTIKIRAMARLGDLIRQLEKRSGKHSRGGGSSGSRRVPLPQAPPTLKDLGITKKVANVAQALAALPPDVREKIAAREMSMADVRRTAIRKKRVERVTTITARTPAAALDTLEPVPILYADPPWQYEHVRTEVRAVENHYPTMTLEAIRALKPPATPDAILFMWATSPKLAEAMTVLEAWGFTYRTCMVWIKNKIGMGYYVRQQHELLLIAARGELPVPEPQNRPASVVHGNRSSTHSQKPEIFYELIERMYPEYAKRELFQRGKARAGWLPGFGFEVAS